MSSRLHALLVGIGHYFPPDLPDGGVCTPLHGPVRDVARLRCFLERELGVPDGRIRVLTASAGEGNEPVEPQESRPTYANLVEALTRLGSEASPGDEVFFYYSGHGARTATQFPDLKGEGGWDESLVPCDAGDPGSRFLLDVELNVLVQRMVERELRVSLVLDSCHGGGALRGRSKAVARGLGFRDGSSRSAESRVAARSELAAAWTRRVRGHRGLAEEGWLPSLRGVVLLAACHPDEEAIELPFEDDEYQGALTYWLLETLRRHGIGVTWRRLHACLLARIHSDFAQQTPILEGDGDRLFLAGSRIGSPASVVVLRREEDGRLLLNTGASQGVKAGDLFAIHPPCAEIGPDSRPQALAEVQKAGATESLAEVIEGPDPAPIEPGAQARLVGSGSLQLVRAVALAPQGAPGEEAALAAVRAALHALKNRFIRLAAEGEGASLQVAVTPQGAFEIWDAAGRALPVSPVLRVADPLAVPCLIGRLEHLARYQAIRQIENLKPAEGIEQALEVRFAGEAGAPAAPAGALWTLRPGDQVVIEIANRSSRDLNVAVLNLQPNWAIEQAWPGPDDFPTRRLPAGKSKRLRVRGDREGVEVFKVFATLGTTSFRWLQMPPLDEPPPARRGEAARSLLEQLFDEISALSPRRNTLTPSDYPEEEWTTRDLTVRVEGVPAGPGGRPDP